MKLRLLPRRFRFGGPPSIRAARCYPSFGTSAVSRHSRMQVNNALS